MFRVSRYSKYKAAKTTFNGIVFDSKREAQRYSDLLVLERLGRIQNLSLQVRFKLAVNGINICAYVLDFTYVEDGKLVAEDVKGFETPVFKLKAKLFRAIWSEWDLRIVK